MLSGAGVIQALDSRETGITSSLKGLYQAITYHSGLSGGSWLLSAIAGNDFPTISSLNTNTWSGTLPNMTYTDDALLMFDVAVLTSEKNNVAPQTGLNVTLTDPWGLWIGWSTLPNFGQNSLLSSVASSGNFTSGSAPFPIITSIGVNTWWGDVVPRLNGTQYEFNPYEFGSWDDGVDAFMPTTYLGTEMGDGVPASSSNCMTNADNMAWIQGTSSNLFNVCGSPDYSNTIYCELGAALYALAQKWNLIEVPESRSWWANYTNPFFNYTGSPGVANQPFLNLVDGGESYQNNPIWPYLQPERNVDVIIVNDNSADINPGTIDGGGYPSGGALYNTSMAARAAQLKKMPPIPPESVFIDEKLNQRATFFGCDNPESITIIYLPNYDFTYDSGTPTDQFTYSTDQINGMIGNGNAISTQNGDQEWPVCMACALVKKTGEKVPDRCQGCFEKYCWQGPIIPN
jgi:lysophospholipase